MLKSGNYEVLVFHSHAGEVPYSEWLASLNANMRERILSRVNRLKWGQFGDFKSLNGGLYEMRLDFGPGYRVYFGEHKSSVVLLLTGGDKSTQRRDIAKARKLLKNFLEDNT